MKWTDEEIEILRTNPDKPLKKLEKILGRPRTQISAKRMKLGLGKLREANEWTEEEIDILKKMGNNFYSHEIKNYLPRHTTKSIQHKLERLGITKNGDFWVNHMKKSHKSDKWRVVNYMKLDQNWDIFDLEENLYQVLIGSMMGDGGVHRINKGHNYYFKEAHGPKQKDYLLWKKDVFSVFCPCYCEKNIAFSTPVHSIFKKLREEFYNEQECRKAYVPLKYIEKLNALGLLIWYLDDGRQHHTFNPTIASGLFTKEDLQKTIDIINKNLNLHSHIQGPHIDKRTGGSMFTIYFPTVDQEKLLTSWQEIFSKHKMPDCMKYKLKTKPVF